MLEEGMMGNWRDYTICT